MGNQDRQRDSRVRGNSPSLESGKPHSVSRGSLRMRLRSHSLQPFSAEGKVEGF